MSAKESVQQGIPHESFENSLIRLGRDPEARQLFQMNQVVASLEPKARENLKYLGSLERKWMPNRILHDHEKVRKNAERLSATTIVALVGNTVTEKGLPSYMAALNKSNSLSDKTGRDRTAAGEWVRGWTADELKHEQVMDGWMLLSDRVNMRTYNILCYTQMRNGFDPKTRDNPYKGFIYTSAQELATVISHRNTGKLAIAEGDEVAAEMCGLIVPDEQRHFNYYLAMGGEIFKADPDGAMIAFDEMMSEGIVMPGALMSDKLEEIDPKIQKTEFFDQFEIATQKSGVYTGLDYLYIFDTLLQKWDIEHKPLTTAEAEKSREHVIKLRKTLGRVLPDRYERILKAPEPQFELLLKAA